MRNLTGELRQTLRGLIKSPIFPLSVIVTLALGIGANTAVFSIVSALLLKPLPYADADRLVTLSFPSEKRGARGDSFSWERFRSLRENHPPFELFSAWAADSVSLTGGGEPEQLTAARVSSDFFRVMGVQPIIGRDLAEGEDEPGANAVALISHDLWQRRFGGSRDVLGQTIDLDSKAFTIIGVMPRTFHYPQPDTTVWIPVPHQLSFMTPKEIQIGAAYLAGVARLREGVSVERAQADMEVGNSQYVTQFRGLLDADPDAQAQVTPLKKKILGNVEATLLTLFASVTFVLLIACANIAGLFLARATARSKELAIRAALGASRGRLVRLALSESEALSLLGGLLGVVLASVVTSGVAAYVNRQLPRADEIKMDGAVLAFALMISILSGLISGLIPAIQVSRPDLNNFLRDSNWGTSGGQSGSRIRSWLVVGQVAVSMVLLVGAGLMMRSFLLLERVEPGFDPSQLLTMKLYFSPTRYPDAAKRRAYAKEIVRQVQDLPGVKSAAIGFTVPLTDPVKVPVQIEGRAVISLNERPVVQFQSVTPTYFDTLRIELKEGRTFTEHDTAEVAPLVLVNEKMARRFWPDEDAVGRRLLLPDGKVREVIGVVSDVKNTSLREEAQEQLYVAYDQFPLARTVLMVRTSEDPEKLVADIKGRIHNADKDQPVSQVRSMETVFSENTGQMRLLLLLLAAFAGTALVLAMVGLYGVLAYWVTQRRKELAIRIALGSTRQAILGLVVKHGLRLVLFGVVFGVVASLFLTRLLASLLYHVSATDPAIFVGVSLALFTVGTLASFLPAYRASSVDPIRALRDV